MNEFLFFVVGCFFSYMASAQVDHWETAVFDTDTFRYFIGTQNPPVTWKDITFNDSTWEKGKGGIGYGETDLNTIIPGNTWSVFLRKSFDVPDTGNILAAVLNVDFDDGFVVWLNGVEVARANLGQEGVPPDYSTPATSLHEAVMYQGQNPPYFLVNQEKLKQIIVPGRNVVTLEVNNANLTSSDLVAHLFLSFAMKNPGLTFAQVPSWFIAPSIETGSSLPLVMIETGGQWVPHTPDRIEVDFGIIDNGPGKFNHSSDAWNYFKAKASLAVRGSSSTMFDKKNYALEIHDIYGLPLDTSILNLPTENDFVLYGPYPDKSLLRNYLMYYLANDIGQYAPRTRMCELYIDGDYRGFYLVIEKIKRDKNRVNIAKLQTTDISGLQLTGGYIVKIDRSANGNGDGWFSPYTFLNTEIFFVNEYPSYDVIQPVQKRYIQDKITAFESLLISDKYTDPDFGYRPVIDAKSFAEHFILSEFCKNVDAYRLSTFLYKDRDDHDPRIHMGPIWDYDLSFGNANYNDASLTYNWEYMYPEPGQPFWWQRLMSDPWFENLVKCRYEQMRQGALNTDSINAVIDTAIAKMGPEVQKNFDRWPILGTYVWPNNFIGNTYEEEINYLKQWIKARAEWMDNNLPGVCISTGINDKEVPQQLMAYPNPAVGSIHIEAQNPAREKVTLDVYNVFGQRVFSVVSEDELIREQVSLPSGTYIARLTTGSGNKTLKFIMQ